MIVIGTLLATGLKTVAEAVMVKTPKTRHSASVREPMTIDLGPDDVSRLATDDSPPSPAVDASVEKAKEDIGASAAAEMGSGTSTAGFPVDDNSEPSAAPIQDPASAEAASKEAEAPESPQPAPADGDGSADLGRKAKHRSSAGAGLAAGLAGGIVALAAAGLLQYAGVLGTPGASNIGNPAPPASTQADIDAIKSDIEALKAGLAPADVSGVTTQVTDLSEAMRQANADIAALKQAVESGSAGDGAALQSLNTKITDLENRLAAVGPAADGATAEDIAAVNERVAGVEATAKAAADAGTDLGTRLGALEQSLAALSAKVEAQAGQPKVALAIAASALKAAIERGSPFHSELETFAAIAPEAPGLTELRRYSEEGVATRADIVAETDAAAKAMIAAANPPPANAGFFERLLSSAESLVTVRPVGSVEGPGTPETVARMEVALKNGDLAKAIAEYDTLPEAAKAAGAAFADKIKARIAVEQLADGAVAAAMQAA